MCYFTTLTAASSTSTRGSGAGKLMAAATTDNHDFKSCEFTTTYEHKTHTEYSID